MKKILSIALIPAAVIAGAANRSPVEPAPVTASGYAATPAPGTGVAAPIRFVVAPTGNEARYRVREQLVGLDLPNDAVGVTRQITGAIVVNNGQIVRSGSKIVVDLAPLKSDKDRRDGYVQRRLLETEKYPTVELVPVSVRGLPRSLPKTGSSTFEMVGNLKVRDVTRPTTWRVAAKFEQGQVTGTATTKFTFADINMAQPRVPVVLSVADTIQLEYDFTLVPAR